MTRSALPVLAVALTLGSARAEAPTNPHGAAEACASCHVSTDGAVGAAKEVAASCYSCHPEETHHPMEMVPTEFHPPAGWPLEQGKVVCTTCHVEPAHAGLSDAPSPYFRGGPYAVMTDFCFSCHSKSAVVSRTDPHRAASPYAAGDPTCGACHDAVPERGAAPGMAHLRLEPSRACATCHPAVPHLGVDEHVGKQVPAKVIAGLPPEMPLDGSAIACWTCHDVHAGHAPGAVGRSDFAKALHAAAIAEPWAEVPADAIYPGALTDRLPMLARPLEKGALCSACHGEGP